MRIDRTVAMKWADLKRATVHRRRRLKSHSCCRRNPRKRTLTVYIGILLSWPGAWPCWSGNGLWCEAGARDLTNRFEGLAGDFGSARTTTLV
jgi:hypothetical protein